MENHIVSYNDLVDYVLGELTAENRQIIEQHLPTCTACTRTLRQLTALLTVVRAGEWIEPPASTVARARTIFVQHRRPSTPRHARFNLFPRIPAFVSGFAVALLLIIALGAWIANQDIPSDSALYPIKVTVQGLQVTLSNTAQRLGIQAAPTATATVPPGGEPAPQPALPSDIVISQVYGGGGNTGALYTHDFIELFNRGKTTVTLTGWSLQYSSATGTSNLGAGATQLTELGNVSLEPGQYLLIQEARGNDGTLPLPTPDVIDPTPIALSATGGKVALVNHAKSLGCNGGTNLCVPSALASIIDFVGYGKADFFEGLGPTPEGSNTTAIVRLNQGCTDTNNNMDDFVTGVPNPRNSTTPRIICPAK